MDAVYEDVLDAAGVTGVEHGWLQLHAEPVVRDATGRLVATLWLQAAFEPGGGATVEFLEQGTQRRLASAVVPSITGGAAVRWRVELPVSASPAVVLRVDAPVPAGADRVRSPWKLLDTIELKPGGDRQLDAGAVLGSVVGGVLLGGVGAAAGAALLSSPEVTERQKYHVHQAPAQAPTTVPILDGEAAAAGVEVLWRPGEPLDTSRLRLLPRRPGSGVSCACGTVAPAEAEFCPSCLATLRAAPVASAVLSPPSEAPPAESAARCPRHAERPVAGSCQRCGGFFCVECVPDFTGDLATCPRCTERDRDPNAQMRELGRNVAIQLGAAGGAILLLGGVLPLLVFDAEDAVYALIGAGILAGPLLGAMGLALAFRAPWTALVALLLQGGIVLVGVTGQSLLLVALFGVLALISFLQWRRMVGLRDAPQG